MPSCQDYCWLRGFNVIPSWGVRIEQAWRDYDAGVERTAAGYRVTVTAKTLVRDLTLFADRLDPAARVDVQMLDLLPGERGIFNITSRVELNPAALVSAPVLQSVN